MRTLLLLLMILLTGCSFDQPEQRIVYVEDDYQSYAESAEWHSEHDEDSEELLLGTPRSGEWRAVRQAHIRDNPECIACGQKTELFVHHIVPYHVNPKLELDRNNLATFCFDHHLGIGHNGNWKQYNLRCVDDAAKVRKNLGLDPIKNRGSK